MAILEIDTLEIRHRSARGEAHTVDRVSLSIERGEALGLVGESGCGKSTVAKAVMGILPSTARVMQGQIRCDGIDLLALSPSALREQRWKKVALVPQTAMNGFDPVYRIDQQLDETLRAHGRLPASERRERLRSLFELVGIHPDRLKNYPHEYSGGMRQRAMIAMALLFDPPVLVADEPTTGLDVLVQDQIMQRIKAIQADRGMAILLISHDMALIAENCDRIAVMYAGRIVELGGREVMLRPFHPYTLGLRNAFPDVTERRSELVSIPGSPPSLFDPPAGCRFRARCPFATAKCAEDPPLVEVAPRHHVACHHVDSITQMRIDAANPETWTRLAQPA
jgi:oligopeptide/dipeptide ABC transporter ATP-binding protein